MHARLLLIGLAATLAACRGLDADADAPAWLASSSAASREELTLAVRRLIGQREIRLSTDAFTASHVLLLEPAARNRLDGPVLGRNLSQPERFELALRAGRCELVHTDSGRRVRLRGIVCIPAAAH